ncbi:alcohol dehydrogenase catalytic domain-containing protein [Streptomyces sp. NPDC005356]|uniref:alcohol dehydrogenase catalytic domain-containing protein n=1 Tax=Streptomyces sp. NPDC005356 TaxID=3157167 RepID=UPI00339FFC94
MKGYVIQEKGRADWHGVPVPEIGPYDALVRPTTVAACTTDVHLIDSLSLPNALGKVIGHEAVGLVERVGDQVTDFAPGDRVVLPAGLADWRHPGAQRGEGKFHQSKSPGARLSWTSLRSSATSAERRNSCNCLVSAVRD